ncbi:MAG: mammalian cell entry protein [Chitinophagaceae bacterium]|nr:mammalian cell entry protein [Chitinophagaceae bacterium]
MKISNETKVGALTAIAITLLILGYNFIRGKTLFKTGHFIYAKYIDTKQIMISNPVYINGFQVGSVFEIENTDQALSSILVTIKLKDYYMIPDNSVAVIKESILGTPSIDIRLGNSKKGMMTGDTILTASDPGMVGQVMSKLGPVGDQLKQTIQTLDDVLKNINTVFDPATKNNLQKVIANMNSTTASLVGSAASIEKLLNQQSGAITQSMNNINSFTKNLSENNDKVSRTLSNVEKTTEQLSQADIKGSVTQLKAALEKLNGLIAKVDSQEGSLGKLINDKALYNNLNNTMHSANILLDDLRVHPKRYVQISVFGKKDKSGPLMAPLSDSTKTIQK